MKTIKDMSEAGMYLSYLAEQVKGAENLRFDVRSYLAEKLESAFYDVQSDILLAVQSTVQADDDTEATT